MICIKYLSILCRQKSMQTSLFLGELTIQVRVGSVLTCLVCVYNFFLFFSGQMSVRMWEIVQQEHCSFMCGPWNRTRPRTLACSPRGLSTLGKHCTCLQKSFNTDFYSAFWSKCNLLSCIWICCRFIQIPTYLSLLMWTQKHLTKDLFLVSAVLFWTVCLKLSESCCLFQNCCQYLSVQKLFQNLLLLITHMLLTWKCLSVCLPACPSICILSSLHVIVCC